MTTPSDTAISTEQTALYRYYDEDDQLLYVGIANDPFRRMAQHRHGKGWWADVARMELERFNSRPAALEAERLAIAAEHPLYNIVHANRTTRSATTIITLWCTACGLQIVGTAGYLCVDSDAAFTADDRVRAADRARESTWQPLDLSALIKLYGSPIVWQAFHAACDPHPDNSDYWFSADRIETLAELFDWNAHLLGKRWIKYTNWTRMLVAATSGEGPLHIENPSC